MIPNKINFVDITLQKNQTATQHHDDVFMERTRSPKLSAAYMISGLPVYFSADSPQIENFGVSLNTTGYFVFRIIDLEAAGIDVEFRDKVTKIGLIDVEVWINEVRPTAHYAAQGGATLKMAFFQDRAIK